MGREKKLTVDEIDQQIAQLKNRKKDLLTANKKQEKVNRNRRLIILGSRIEAFYKNLNIDLKPYGNDIPEDMQNDIYRYVAIGYTLEQALGEHVDASLLPKLSTYIKSQEERGRFLSKALLDNCIQSNSPKHITSHIKEIHEQKNKGVL